MDEEPVAEQLVPRLRLLGVHACDEPLAFALGDQRRLEVGVGDRGLVADAVGQLECLFDVGARRFPVAPALVATRAFLENSRAKRVAVQAGAVAELEREREQRNGVRDRGEVEAAAAEPVEDGGAVAVVERRPLGNDARPVEQSERTVELAERHPRPRLCEQAAQSELRSNRERCSRESRNCFQVLVPLDRLLSSEDGGLGRLPRGGRPIGNVLTGRESQRREVLGALVGERVECERAHAQLGIGEQAGRRVPRSARAT